MNKFLFILFISSFIFGQNLIIKPPELTMQSKTIVTQEQNTVDGSDSIWIYPTTRRVTIDSLKDGDGNSAIIYDSLAVYDDSLRLLFDYERDVVGSFTKYFYAYHTGYGSPDTSTVDYTINSSTEWLYAPYNLIASTGLQGINLVWNDSNVTDISLSERYTFDADDTQQDDWESGASQGQDASIDEYSEKLRVTEDGSDWGYYDARKIYDTLSSSKRYIFTVDSYIGDADRVYLVIKGWNDDVLAAEYETNYYSTTDSTFIDTVSFPTYDSLFVALQGEGVGTYVEFDNYEMYILDSASYDKHELQTKDWRYNALAGSWIESNSWDELITVEDMDTSYFHSSANLTYWDGIDSAKHTYRVRFINSADLDTTAWSNLDTALYVPAGSLAEFDVDTTNVIVEADYWIRSDAATLGDNTWTEATDSSKGITLATLSDNIDNIGANKTIAFKGGQTHLGSLNFDGASYLLDGLTLTRWGRGETIITLYDTLDGWSNPDNWSDSTADADGAYWKIDLETLDGEGGRESDQYNYGMYRLWLDDVEYPSALTLNQIYVRPAYYDGIGISNSSGGESPSVFADSSFYSLNDTYRWKKWAYDMTITKRTYVWTPDSSNPATYYSSIKQASANSVDNSYGNAMDITEVDNFLIQYLTIEGGEYNNLALNGCDNGVIKYCRFKKNNYRSIQSLSSSDVDYLHNEFIAYDTTDTFTVEEGVGKEGIALDFNSDDNYIYGNKFYNYSTFAFAVRNNVPDGGYETGIPDNNIIDSNFVYNTMRNYARGVQVHSNEDTNATYKPTYLLVLAPTNTIITRNLFENMNVETKLNGNGITFMHNIYIGRPEPVDWRMDHTIVQTDNDGYFCALVGGDMNNTYISNNTFINVQMGVFNTYFNAEDLWFENNLVINGNTTGYYSRSDFVLSSTSGWIEFGINSIYNSIEFNNNYIYNDSLTTGETRVAYRRGFANEYIGTYSGLESHLSGDANRNLADNITDVTSTGVTDFFPSFASDIYEVNTSNGNIYQSSKTIAYKPAWLLYDIYGNLLTTNPNIGAVNNE